ncbi:MULTISPECIES: hypothetical protein [unclassified Aliiroseovarius]|uniref:hypothetical protein n=1 Tax=unclassified Aliiroseovarius TaxID=2623558 RepID=UPI0015690269|nr:MULTISPECIES: hypothetical protein [unclassified Aliiroseovarius]
MSTRFNYFLTVKYGRNMFFGIAALVMIYAVMAVSAFSLVFAVWCGFHSKPRASFFVAVGLSVMTMALVLSAMLTQNTEELRQAFGSETHEGVILGTGVIVAFVAIPSVLLSAPLYWIGKLMKRRKEMRKTEV